MCAFLPLGGGLAVPFLGKSPAAPGHPAQNLPPSPAPPAPSSSSVPLSLRCLGRSAVGSGPLWLERSSRYLCVGVSELLAAAPGTARLCLRSARASAVQVESAAAPSSLEAGLWSEWHW